MLCLTLWLVYLLSVVAADLYNPVFTETALKVNRSDATHNIPYSTETIVISQDFQVVSKTDKTYIRTNILAWVVRTLQSKPSVNSTETKPKMTCFAGWKA
ncbi:hypothetical protein BY458DRAFT_68863 [Sporodiniella umbellata]|nr:hypothetical protein BY458DRAFT_68863 [Sporodiniella umbellata]